jgi:hypothetical protein
MIAKRNLFFLLQAFISCFFVLRIFSFGYCGELKPTIAKSPLIKREAMNQTSYIADMMMFMIRGYQLFISPVDGDRCKMYPNCSAYSYQAYKTYGPVMGTLLTFDRLTHEMDEYKVAKIIDDVHDSDWLVKKYRNLLIYDPLIHNVFWWKNINPKQGGNK